MITLPHVTRIGPQKRSSLLVLGAMVLLASLAGCAPESPAESAPPATPTTPAAAQDEAYDGALDALQHFVETTQDLDEAGDGETAPLELFASGQALADAVASIEQYRTMGYAASGTITLEPYEHEVRTDEEQSPAVPDGEVVIRSCIDYTDWRLTDAEGSPSPRSGPDRSTFEHHVVLDAVSNEWKVSEGAATGADC